MAKSQSKYTASIFQRWNRDRSLGAPVVEQPKLTYQPAIIWELSPIKSIAVSFRSLCTRYPHCDGIRYSFSLPFFAILNARVIF
ncbi:hypothetical protein [Melioribacter sp. OK-6-Me]|uniref:hypothetical protein n=1 Tax=unclassified Melioribacter TaxID=2627329 RepID=UPI003F5CC43B